MILRLSILSVPLAEVVQYAQSRPAALFRVKLKGHKVFHSRRPKRRSIRNRSSPRSAEYRPETDSRNGQNRIPGPAANRPGPDGVRPPGRGFQPIWGIFSDAPFSVRPAGNRRVFPLTSPRHSVPPSSSLNSRIICVPRQMPIRGVPRSLTSRSTTSSPRRFKSVMADPAAPTPGNMTRSAAQNLISV